MKIDEPEAMKMIRKIREKQYEETKDMTPKEQTAYDRAKSEELMKRYGLNLKVFSKSFK
jgi:hypothetical protein